MLIVGCTKTVIDIDDEVLVALAARKLGMSTKKDMLNAPLPFITHRRNRVDQLLDDPFALGVGPDFTDSEVVGQARR
jgi:Arc/MetJ family transcription regulator